MAETLLSPGVLARENDNTFIQQQPIDAGAAIVGPTVKGPVQVPTLVTSYTDYQNRFGTTFESGSDQYTYLTSISAYNYFQNGGDSLLVTRVVGDVSSWGYASAAVESNTAVSEGGVYTSSFGTLSKTSTGSYAGIAVNVGSNTYYADNVFYAVPGQSNNTTFVTTKNNANTGYVTETTNIYYVGMGGGVYSWDIDTWGPKMAGAINQYLSANVSASYDSSADELYVSSSADLQTPQLVKEYELYADLGWAQFAFTDGTDVTDWGGGSDGTYTTAFQLEAIDKGALFNNTSSILANGALDSGSKDNIRWEINTANTSSGTFSLVIRRGDDNDNSKTALETWTNLSLDPKAENYISKVIGDQKLNYNPSENYLEVSGSYPNASRYVRVKSVDLKTPNYFDNAGVAKDMYTGSIPAVGSGSYGGSFAGGTGDLIPSSRTMNMYDKINNVDSQGLVSSDYTSMLTLLANQDEYRYNLMLLPGMTDQYNSSVITTAISNAQSRGDHLVVIDPVGYAASLIQAKNEASGRDTSYAAMYWPWLRTIDPDSGENVWVPASTMMGGVFAFNDNASEPWFAPAGINRGGLGSVIQAERKLSATNRDDLYAANVNPIATFPGTGVVVYGQKTLQKKSSALDRVNVRRLLIELKGYISQIAQNLVFEQNTAATRNNFLAQVNPYLESVQARQGLYAFKVIMDDSNNTPDVIDRNQMVGQIYIQPTRTAEFIYLDFNLQPTGATFPA